MYTLQKRMPGSCSTIGKLAVFIVLFFNIKLHGLFARAVEIPFYPITPGFEGLFGGDGGVTITSVLSSIFFFLIALGAIIAVLRIAMSGITYMLSESFTSKESAKKGLQGSVLGLLLLLSVVLILNQINANLVNMSILRGAPTAPNVEFTPSTSSTQPSLGPIAACRAGGGTVVSANRTPQGFTDVECEYPDSQQPNPHN